MNSPAGPYLMDMISLLAGDHSLSILCILAGAAFIAGASTPSQVAADW